MQSDLPGAGEDVRRTPGEEDQCVSASGCGKVCQRNAWWPSLVGRLSRWSCTFKGRVGCSGR